MKRLLYSAVIVAAAPVGVFLVGFVSAGGTLAHAALTFGSVLAFALAAGLMFAYDRKFFFTGTVMGFVVGTLFGADLLFEVPFEDQFAVSAMTMMFFVVLGVVLGAIAEFIHLLHHAVHGGRIEHCVTDTDDEPESEEEEGTVARK